MTSKTPTPQGISALLRKAGFERSTSTASRVRGWHNHSWGYVVKAGDHDGEVRVYHRTGWIGGTDETKRQEREQQEQYAEAIEAAGFTVKRGDGGPFGALVVSALPGTEA